MTGKRSKPGDTPETRLEYLKPTLKRFGLMSDRTKTDPDIPPKGPEDDLIPDAEEWGDPS